LTDATSPVLIRNAQEAIAYFTAALASGARGSPLSERWDDAGSDALEDLISRAVCASSKACAAAVRIPGARATARLFSGASAPLARALAG